MLTSKKIKKYCQFPKPTNDFLVLFQNPCDTGDDDDGQEEEDEEEEFTPPKKISKYVRQSSRTLEQERKGSFHRSVASFFK